MLEMFRPAIPNIAAVIGLALIPLFVISNPPSKSASTQVMLESSKETRSAEILSNAECSSDAGVSLAPLHP